MLGIDAPVLMLARHTYEQLEGLCDSVHMRRSARHCCVFVLIAK